MNPKFAQFDKLFGVQTPTPQNGVPNRSAQILQMEKQTQSAQPSQPTGIMGKIGGTIRAGVDAPKNIGTAIGTGIADIVSGNNTEMGNALSTVQPNLGSMAKTATTVTKGLTSDVLAPVTSAFNVITPQSVKDLASGAVEGIKGGVSDFVNGLAPELKQTYDKLPQDWKDTVANSAQTGMNVLGLAGVAKTPMPTPTNIVEGGIKTGAKIADTASTVAGKAKALVTKTPEELANKNLEGVTNLIKPSAETMTPTMKKEAIASGQQTVTKTKLGGTKVDYMPTKETQRAAQILSDGTEFKNPVLATDEPNVVYAKTKTAISQRGAQAEKYLADNPVKVTNTEASKMYSDMLTKASKSLDDTQMNAYKGQIKLFEKQLLEHVGDGGYTTENFYKALKDYENNVASNLPRGKETLIDPTGVGSAKINAAADIRKTVRDMIGSKHPEFQPQMYDLASLYEAKDNALFNASKAKTQNIFQKYPTATKAAKIIVGGTIADKALKGAIGIGI